jgi:Tfp pilus assembly protein PilN
MLKINLLPKKKSKKSDAGQQTLLIGLGSVLAAAAAVFFLIHQPIASDIESDRTANQQMRDKLKKLSEKTKDFEKLEAAFNAAQKQQAAIERLRNARSTPAWLLYELATILTKDRNPTMTPEMAKRVREDPNRGWVQGWDPKHVWITQFSESRGRFKLSGAAQSDSDMTQLALRLQASVYFDEVLPQTGKEAFNKAGGVSYYNFVITGKVVY